jgi:hypothetical protein
MPFQCPEGLTSDSFPLDRRITHERNDQGFNAPKGLLLIPSEIDRLEELMFAAADVSMPRRAYF